MALAYRTTRIFLLRMTTTTKITLLQRPTICQPDSRCDYWAVWTNQCIRMFYHLPSLGDPMLTATCYIDQVPPTAPTTQETSSKTFSLRLAIAPQVHRLTLIPRLDTHPLSRRPRATAGPTRRSDTMRLRVRTSAGLTRSMRQRTPLPVRLSHELVEHARGPPRPKVGSSARGRRQREVGCQSTERGLHQEPARRGPWNMGDRRRA